MRAEGDGFAFDLRDLSRDTRYALKNGHDRSRWYTVAIVRRPRLTGSRVTVTPPAYTGEEPFALEASTREASLLTARMCGSRRVSKPASVSSSCATATP
jgi:hypothetical protein